MGQLWEKLQRSTPQHISRAGREVGAGRRRREASPRGFTFPQQLNSSSKELEKLPCQLKNHSWHNSALDAKTQFLVLPYNCRFWASKLCFNALLLQDTIWSAPCSPGSALACIQTFKHQRWNCSSIYNLIIRQMHLPLPSKCSQVQAYQA